MEEPMTTPADASVAKLRRKIKARVDEIKAALAAYIESDTNPLTDDVEVSIALLDMALDRYIDLHGEQDARQLIESAFCRAVGKMKTQMPG
jgi:hypothetical protein